MGGRRQDVRLRIDWKGGHPVVTLDIGEAANLDALGLGAIAKGRPEITYNRDRVQANGKKGRDGIELRFGAARPTEEVRNLLKEHGYRFSTKQVLWYAPDNEKARELAKMLAETEVDIDTTVYEKLHFWARVKDMAEYNGLRNSTEFMVKETPPRFFNTKNALESSSSNPAGLIKGWKLNFKKFYNKVVGEEEPGGGEPGGDEPGRQEPEPPGEDMEMLELEAEAEVELLRMRVEAGRRKKAGGLSGLDPARLSRLRARARGFQDTTDAMDFR